MRAAALPCILRACTARSTPPPTCAARSLVTLSWLGRAWSLLCLPRWCALRERTGGDGQSEGGRQRAREWSDQQSVRVLQLKAWAAVIWAKHTTAAARAANSMRRPAEAGSCTILKCLPTATLLLRMPVSFYPFANPRDLSIDAIVSCARAAKARGAPPQPPWRLPLRRLLP